MSRDNYLAMIRRATTLALLVTFLPICSSRSQLRAVRVLPRSTDFGTFLYTGVSALDDHNCFAVGVTLIGPLYHPFTERSVDGGKNWTRGSIFFPPFGDLRQRYFNEVTFIDSANILLTGDSGLIYRTTDAGENWTDQSYPWIAAAALPAFLNDSVGIIAMGGGVLIKTLDGGNTWQKLSGLPYCLLASPKIFSKDSFLVVKSGTNLIYRFSQGGARLDSTRLPFDIRLTDTGGYRSIGAINWFGDKCEGFAFGLHYRRISDSDHFQTLVEYTSDCGYSWSQVLDSDLRRNIVSTSKNGNSLLLGDNGNVTWSSDWRSDVWHTDSFDVAVYGEAGYNIMLDRNHALALYDDGSLLVNPGASTIFRLTFGPQSRVEAYEDIVWSTHIYPNPASNEVNIVSSEKGGEVALYDILGREMLRGKLPSNGPLRFDTRKLDPGIYSVVLNHLGNILPVGRVVLLAR